MEFPFSGFANATKEFNPNFAFAFAAFLAGCIF